MSSSNPVINKLFGLTHLVGCDEKARLEYSDPSLNGALTYTVRLVDASKACHGEGRFDLLDEDEAGAFAQRCAKSVKSPAVAAQVLDMLGKKAAEELAKRPKAKRAKVAKAFQPFPTHVLPEPFAQFVRDAAAAMGVDESFVALPLLVLLGAAIGTTRRIKLKSTWKEYPIIWAIVVAYSGQKKSPPFDAALAPIHAMQRQAQQKLLSDQAAHTESEKDYKAKLAEWKAAKKLKAAVGEPPEPPPPPAELRHFKVQDTTIEAVATILSKNERGVLMYRDELSGWMAGMNEYKGGKGSDAAHWLEMFSGRPDKIDRVGRGTIFIPRSATWITGTIQPDILRRCLGAEHIENGLAFRPLYAFPPKRQVKWSEAELDENLETAVRDAVRKLFGLTFRTMPDGDQIPFDVPLSYSAKQEFIRFVNDHGAEQFEMNDSALESAWSKLEGYAARLALIVHFARWAAGDSTLADVDKVDFQSMKAGIALSRWFGGEFERLLSFMRESDEDAEVREIVEIIRGMGGTVTVRAFQRRGKKYAVKADAVAALSLVEAAGLGEWKYPQPGHKGGHPTTMFALKESVPRADSTPSGEGVCADTTPDSDSESGVSSVSALLRENEFNPEADLERDALKEAGM